MSFKLFAKRVKAQFDKMAEGELFQVNLGGDFVFEQTAEQEKLGLLEEVMLNSVILRESTLQEIRTLVQS